MKNNHRICVFGGTGIVGMAACKTLIELGYLLRIGVRNVAKAEKEFSYAGKNVQLFKIDMDNENHIKEFCSAAELVVGAAGPSTRYSEKMLYGAVAAGIPYVDPGGMHLRGRDFPKGVFTTAVIGAGLFPGLAGWLLNCMIGVGNEKKQIEIVIGGKYNFSRAAASDYVEEAQDCTAGIPMACVRNGKIVPAERRIPLDIPGELLKLSFLPYVTEEIQEIVKGKTAVNIDAYTAAPTKQFSIMKNLNHETGNLINHLVEQKVDEQKAIICIRERTHDKKVTFFLEGDNPGILTGKILAISANAVMHLPRKTGIFPMARYLAKYPLLDELGKIEKLNIKRNKNYE